jgi:hypothetical protein
MGKNKNFSGQPILSQLLSYIDRQAVKRTASECGSERYVKKFSTYQHLVVMLYATVTGCTSLREVTLGLLSEAFKVRHLGLTHQVARSTLSEANCRRSSKVFEAIYNKLYRQHAPVLADSRNHGRADGALRLFIIDSTTITLFKDILKGVGRKAASGRRKGGIKAHTMIEAGEAVPCLVRHTAAASHDHLFLREAEKLPAGSFVVFDKGYVDYEQWQRLTEARIWYVTRLKDNAVYALLSECDIPEDAAPGVLRDERIALFCDNLGSRQHLARRVVYLDEESGKVFVFLTNSMDTTAENVALIYKRRWQIELLFKQLKQNFQLKYFLGDNANAVEIQIWVAMIANLILTLVRRKLKRKWAFSNMVSVIRHQAMSYINLFAFLEDPENSWRELNETADSRYRNSLFPEMMKGACF